MRSPLLQHSVRLVAIGGLTCAACAPALQPGAVDFAAAGQELRPEWNRHFDDVRATGVFVLYDVAAGTVRRSDAKRASLRFLPASTFKVFSSMAALDAGVIDGIDDVVAWDGVIRNNAAWDQDQRMREAFQRSAVWFYQELVRRVGPDRMLELLRREGYGNQDISGGIDQFWLSGGLRISADEQVAFLERLHDRTLGFSPTAMDAVSDLLLMQRGDDWVLRGKTGWARADGQLGWIVGWVERDGRTWIYALNLHSDDPRFPMFEARQAVLRGVLRDAGVLP
jgi:beta-lactamase class D